jgi:uncharacterized protein YfaS (alpha-2-macroglobulin family)
MKPKSPYDYLDIRDDRISFFGTVSSKPSVYYYTVRVVSRGNYAMGPVSADAMYNGQYHSASGGRLINVR